MSDEQSESVARGLRAAVDNESLDAENELHYLVLLTAEARRYDGHWEGDPEQAARWTVAQWCQKIGYVPDLQAFDTGEMVPKGDVPDSLPGAFDQPATADDTQDHENSSTSN